MTAQETTLNKHLAAMRVIWSGKDPKTNRGMFLERIVLWLLCCLMFITPGLWVRHFCGLRGREFRKIGVEAYAVIKLLMAALILYFHWWKVGYVPILCGWLLADLFITLAGYIFLRKFWQNPYSWGRSLMLLFINFAEYTSWFACLYLFGRVLKNENGVVTNSCDALYFSVVTAATVGYGDITPNPAGHALVMVEIFASLFFIVMVVGYFVSNMSVTETDK